MEDVHPALRVPAPVYRYQRRQAATLTGNALADWVRVQRVLAAPVQTRLATHGRVYVRETLAHHPHLLPSVIRTLSYDLVLSVRRALARSELPPDVLDRLLDDHSDVLNPLVSSNQLSADQVERVLSRTAPGSYTASLLPRQHLTPGQVDRLLVDTHSARSAAAYGTLTPAVLDCLDRRGFLADPVICTALGANPTLPPDQHQFLAAHPDPPVRSSLARRSDLDRHLLDSLRNDRDRDVRLATAHNPLMDEAALTALLEDLGQKAADALAGRRGLPPALVDRLLGGEFGPQPLGLLLQVQDLSADQARRGAQQALMTSPIMVAGLGRNSSLSPALVKELLVDRRDTLPRHVWSTAVRMMRSNPALAPDDDFPVDVLHTIAPHMLLRPPGVDAAAWEALAPDWVGSLASLCAAAASLGRD